MRAMLAITMTTIIILGISSTIAACQKFRMGKGLFFLDELYTWEIRAQCKLKVFVLLAEVSAEKIIKCDRSMDELTRKEALHLSRITEHLKRERERRRELRICKIGMEHVDVDADADADALELEPAAYQNQTLLLQQFEERKELISTLSALSRVNEQILELMKTKLAFRDLLTDIETDILHDRRRVRWLQSTRSDLESRSSSRSHSYATKLRIC